MAEQDIKYKFSSGFLWGTATSAHQIEGGNENNWTKWEKKGQIKDGSVSGRACNSYELYKEDIRLCKELNNNAYRFSLEWSRIEPEQGKFDKEALKHYQKVVECCRKNNIEPLVTLYHWTQPLWFAKLGGWLHKRSPLFFRNYAEAVAKQLGREVTFWCTINEPMIYSYNSYLKGKWPPQKKSYWQWKKALDNLIKAHKLSYFTLHSHNSKCKVSVAKNNQFFEPYVDSIFNKAVVKLITHYWNYYFLNKIKNELDYIGLNYYFHNLIYASLKGHVLMNENKIANDLGWEIYPKGIYEVLIGLKKYNLPIYILENGLADAKDEKRADFIKSHLRYIYQAIKDGTDVRGYCHWSLLDNFEWSEGYEPKFGLYRVNPKTFERTVRPSAKVYAEIAKNNGF
ncbi:glycoside hydrolase family 1 protein [Candidatus Falkowbacteria bacterium CG10_big_fil_rev_8_21_14_0_10_43_10]|uniref:Glycoside hydrolase family 1 protein n=1 Tax=Candidatus Falkowbacteria bacterium CG10_big_fil_rev_8_21_14_0_10_43_10 TaxID=1974567 RepID=A0A2H0V2P0_9BACT|nr:MAG: glycoside hydrolase family 1 protein [Candidatus Falkowbacteria bacterium CG10_big_fil_rev_8_21_14_0_10_43_10]